MAATRKQVLAKAKELGILVNDDGNAIELEAPNGFLLGLTDSHCSMQFIYGDGAWARPDIWNAVMEYLEAGLEPCEDPECDCHKGQETEE
jgi:hypothetical protein